MKVRLKYCDIALNVSCIDIHRHFIYRFCIRATVSNIIALRKTFLFLASNLHKFVMSMSVFSAMDAMDSSVIKGVLTPCEANRFHIHLQLIK